MKPQSVLQLGILIFLIGGIGLLNASYQQIQSGLAFGQLQIMPYQPPTPSPTPIPTITPTPTQIPTPLPGVTSAPTLTPTITPTRAPGTPTATSTPYPSSPPGVYNPRTCVYDQDDIGCVDLLPLSRAQVNQLSYPNAWFQQVYGVSDYYDYLRQVCIPDLCSPVCDRTELEC